MIMIEADSKQRTLLERLQDESRGRNLLGFAVHRLTSRADMSTFLREFLEQTEDPQTRITVYTRTRRSLISEMESTSVTNRERDDWLRALDAAVPPSSRASQPRR